MVQGIAAHLPAFIDAHGDTLTTEARHTYERVFGSSLQPWMRLTDPRALTVTHGDAHTWNFLFPRSGEGAAFLIDWQLWHLDLGARDLAFFMALHWYPSRRRELEVPLIRYYHEALVTHGINNYAYDELWLDYRRGVVRNLTIPILFWSRGMKPEGWWHRLECALAAYRDLACDDLPPKGLPNKSLQVGRDCPSFIRSLFSQVVALARPPELGRSARLACHRPRHLNSIVMALIAN
jgi:hypothetical protein